MNIKKIYKILLSKINPVKYAQRTNFTSTEGSLGEASHGLLRLEKMCILQMA